MLGAFSRPVDAQIDTTVTTQDGTWSATSDYNYIETEKGMKKTPKSFMDRILMPKKKSMARPKETRLESPVEDMNPNNYNEFRR